MLHSQQPLVEADTLCQLLCSQCLQQVSCSNFQQAVPLLIGQWVCMQVNELARMSEQEVSEYRKQLNGIKVGAAALLAPAVVIQHTSLEVSCPCGSMLVKTSVFEHIYKLWAKA